MFSIRRIIAIICLLFAISATAYVVFVVVPSTLARKTYEGAKQIGDDIRKAFQFTPEITVNNKIILQQQTSVLEVAVLSQTFNHQYEWTNTWMGSTKKINITGTFEAKAGFDLQKKFGISITDDKAVVTLPQPQVLSVESKDDSQFTDEQGVWNWVNQDDRSKAINAFNKDAKRFVDKALFTTNAKAKIEHELRKILKAHDKEVEFRYTESLSKEI
jgi:hypothetical protein